MMQMMGENIEAMKRKELIGSQIDAIKLEDLMDDKFETVDPEESLTDVVAKLRAKDLHEVAVTEDGKKLLGLVSYRSIIRRKNLVIGTKARAAMDLAPLVSPETSVTEVAEHFLSTGYRQMPVVKGNKLVGMVSRAEIASIIPKIKELKVIPVKNIMTESVMTVTEEEPVKNAVDIMRRLDIRTLPVVDSEGRLSGIIGIRDIVNYNWNQKRSETRGEIKGESNPVDIKVSSLDKDVVYTVGPQETLNGAFKLMASKKVSALPVVEDGKILGIVTLYDMVELLASFAKRDVVYMQITGLEEEDRFSLDIMEREIQNGLAKSSKIARPLLFTMHVAKYHSSGNSAKYSLNGRLTTEHGIFIGHTTEWSLIKATIDLMNILDERIMQKKEERVDNRKKSRSEVKKKR